MITPARLVFDASAAAKRRGYAIAGLVALCVRHPLVVLAAALLLCVATTCYVVDHFSMTTDTGALLSHDLPWRKREKAFDVAFPRSGSDLVVVVDGQTPVCTGEYRG